MSEQAPPFDDASGATEAPARTPRALPRIHLRALTADTNRILTIAALVGILLVGGFLRLNHVNWDNNGHLHPDERFLTQISTDTRGPSSIANYFDSDRSAANPYNIKKGDGTTQTTFVYGTLPLFINKFVASHLATPFHMVDRITRGNGDDMNTALDRLTMGTLSIPTRNYDDYDHYNRSGRALSGLFDLGTIILIFLIGRQITNKNVGLLAAFLYALSAFPIQNSHFFVVDPFVTFFAAFTIFFAIRSAQHGKWRDFILAGAGAGLAAACKITAVSLLPVVVLAVGVYSWKGIHPYLAPLWSGDKKEYAEQRDGVALDRSVFTLVFGSVVALIAGFVAFRIAMPYAFNSPSFGDLLSYRSGHIGPIPLVYPDIMSQHWLDDQQDQQRLLSGGAFPPNVQWIGRSRWLWPAQQMVSWGMGPALGVTAWLGLVFAAIYAVVKRQGAWLVPLAWVLGYFGFMGMQFSLYMRYFLPLYPALTVMAAFLMYKAWVWASSPTALDALGSLGARLAPLKPALPVAVRAGVVTIVVFTTLMGLAFYNIYREPVTRAAASVWMYNNIPAGSVIGHEHWDDEVPTSQPGIPQLQYGAVTFNNYDADSPEKVQQLLANIDQVDYIALSSARLSGNIPRVPAQWPVTTRYYETLETGELGFDKVAEFTSYPTIFGREFDDTGAEESYSVYDHPKVTIYKKTAEYSRARAIEVLHADAFVPSVNSIPKNLAQNGIQFRPDVLATQQAGGTWSDIFDSGDVFNRFPLFFWLLAIELAAFALVPLAIVGFRGLPDRGFLLTKPIGVLVLAYLVYEPASFGAFHFERPVIAGALALMIAVGLATAYVWRAEVSTFVRERWRFLLFCEGVFLAAFLFSYWIRLQNPDLYHPYNGGEKPMDFAYFNGVIRTTDLTQGAIDPWNAGGYLNYYWYGQFIAATITKLTGIVPEVAYNLSVPMFFSMAAAATFSLSYNLAESTRRLMRRRPGRLPIGARGPIIAGIFAIFLVLVAGNLRAVGVLNENLDKISPWHTDAPLLGGIVTTIGGFKALLFRDASFHQFVYSYDWWAPSRALTIIPGQQNTVTPITEFPFWTFLFADLHAHLYAIPFSMTAAGVGLGVVMNFSRLNPVGAAREHLRAREISSWGMVLVLALIVGALRWINSWDYPPFLLLSAAALIVGERAKEGRFTLRVVTIGVLKAAVMGLLSFLLFSNIAKNYSQSYSSVERSDQTTDLSDYFTHFGIMLFLMSGFLLFNLNRAITRTNWIRTIFFGSARRRQPVETLPVMAALVVAGALLIWAATFQRWGVIGLAGVGLLAVVLCAARELRSPTATAPVLLFVYAMLALGLGLAGGVEMFTLEGDVGRMNTVFKFYLHVWMMWGVVSAFAMWYLFAVMRPQEAFLKRAGAINTTIVRAPRYAFAGVAVLLIVLSLVYPYFGTRARIHDRFNPAQGSGNDGLAFLDEGPPYIVEYESTGVRGTHNMALTRDMVDWIRANVQGSPTIMEANAPSYRSLGNRVAIYTGLPAVSGWQFHQEQQRVKFGGTIGQRHADIRAFYSTEDAAAARLLLRKYNVQWVIVGDEENFNYPPAGMEKFKDGLGGAMELAYENGDGRDAADGGKMQVWHVIPKDEQTAPSARTQ